MNIIQEEHIPNVSIVIRNTSIGLRSAKYIQLKLIEFAPANSVSFSSKELIAYVLGHRHVSEYSK